MTLDKAIELLTNLSHGGPIPHPQDNIDATELGIEALKRVQVARVTGYAVEPKLLPGETKG